MLSTLPRKRNEAGRPPGSKKTQGTCARLLGLATLAVHLICGFGLSGSFAQIVSEIRIDGTVASDPADVLKAVETPIGASLQSAATQRSITEDLRRISELEIYNPLSLSAELEGTEELKTLIFKVAEYPIVADIAYIGNTKYKKKRLDEELGFEEGQKVFFKPELVDRFKEKLEQFYYSKGFSSVIIEGRKAETTEKGTILEFVIEEGRKLKLQKIGFEGNVHFTNDELYDEIKMKPKRLKIFRRKFDEDEFKTDIQRLVYLYQKNGFLEAKVDSGTRKLVKKNKRLEVNFSIDEGPQYRLGRIEIEGASSFARSELIHPLQVQRGAILDRPQLVQDLQSVRDIYWGQGFRLADIEPEIIPNRESGVADLHLRIAEGPRYRLRKFRVEGVGTAADGSSFTVPLETKDYVVERELQLAQGDVLDWDRVKESERRLMNLQFFEREEGAFPPAMKHGFQIEPVPGTNEMDLALQVEETNTGFIQLGGGFSTDVGPTINLEFKDRNALGRAWLYSFGVEVGKRRQTVDLSFSNPRVNNSPYSLNLSLFGRKRDKYGGREFGERRIGGSIGVGRRLTDETRFSVNYRLEQVQIEDVAETFILRDPDDPNANLADRLFTEESTITSSFEARYTRDTRDYIFFPTSGYHDVLGLEVAGFGGDTQFTRFRGTFDRYLKLREKLVFAWRGHFALSKPFGNTDEIPLHERYFLGGSNTIRGFRIGGIAPFRVIRRRLTDVDGNEIFEDDDVLIGGEAEWYTNLELRYRYNDTVQQIVFFDAGDVYEEVGDFGFGTTRASVGTGLRLNLFSNALVRLDLGFPLAKEEQDKKQSFQFNFGASF